MIFVVVFDSGNDFVWVFILSNDCQWSNLVYLPSVWNWAPESIDRQPAPPPKPYPFGPYLRPWQFLQYSSFSCSAQFVESSILPHIPHLKHPLCHLCPPATRSSAAYTDLPHLGHFGFSAGLKGILVVLDFGLLDLLWN